LIQRIGALDWHLGTGSVGHENAKTPPFVTSPHKNPKPKTEFFSVETRRLAESVDGLNTSLALAAGDLWPAPSLKVASFTF